MKENKRKCFKCRVSPSDNPRTTLHRFPKPGRTNSLRCELWAKYCFPDVLWHSPELQMKLFSEHKMLCNKHFKKSSFIDESLRRLIKSAAPTEENDKMLTSSILDNPESLATCEPVAGPSRMLQPLLENVNILNTNQATTKLSTEVSVPQESGLLNDSIMVPIENQSKPPALRDPAELPDAKKNMYMKCRKYLNKVYRLQKPIKNFKSSHL